MRGYLFPLDHSRGKHFSNGDLDEGGVEYYVKGSDFSGGIRVRLVLVSLYCSDIAANTCQWMGEME